MRDSNHHHMAPWRSCNVGGTGFSPQRRAILMAGAVGFIKLILPASHSFAGTTDFPFPTLADLTQLEPLYEPVLKLRDEQDDPDPEVEALIHRDIPGRPDMLARVRKKLGPYKELHFNVDSLKVGLHYVPELRENYAKSYVCFCKDVTDFLFEATGIPNIYGQISAPVVDNPAVSEAGVSAFVVHQLLKRYVATCSFSTESGKKVRYRFKGDFFSSHKGAVALEIESPAPEQFVLKRKNYSVWQNHTQNPFTLFAIPVEETLHYLLGPHTDRTIENQLHHQGIRTVSEVRQAAVHWMMVEEAVVGGMVHLLLEQYAEKYPLPLSPADIKDRMVSMESLPQFKYRPAGIQLVRDLGYRDALSLYQDDPAAFESRLVASA